MLSYHNDIAVKNKYIDRMRSHIAADEVIQGIGYDTDFQGSGKIKGCAVGCTLDNYQHDQYPIELGIPQWLAHVEDALFEGMSVEKSKTFPLKFLEAIKPGVDLEKVKAPFMIFILKSVLDKFDHAQFPDVLTAVNTIIDLYEDGEADLTKFEAAAEAAEAAARAAARAARAAWAAAWAAARAAWAAARAAEAAEAAARAAEAAAEVAEAAAWAAAWAAARAAAWAAEAAEPAARAAEYDRFADKLLELLRECN